MTTRPLAAAFTALMLLTGTAQALSINVDMPRLSFPAETVTASTKTCQPGAATTCPVDR